MPKHQKDFLGIFCFGVIFLKTLRNVYSKQIQSFGTTCVPLALLCNPQNKVSIVLPHRLNNYLTADTNHMNAFN